MKWIGDPESGLRGVGHSRMVGQCLPEKPHPKIAVKEARVRGLGYPVLSDKLIEVGGAIVRVGIVWVRRPEVVGHSRQSGMLGDEIQQGDLGARWLGDNARWQELADGLVEMDL